MEIEKDVLGETAKYDMRNLLLFADFIMKKSIGSLLFQINTTCYEEYQSLLARSEVFTLSTEDVGGSF